MRVNQSKLQNYVEAARYLLGKVLVRELDGERLSGVIVETEAYHQDDPAAHSFTGHSARTAAMFGPAGRAYIYRSYGIHWCLNVTAGIEGEGSGILIRALQPLEGLPTMRRLRGQTAETQLCNGPGKLAQAMAITKDLYGHDLSKPPLFIEERPEIPDQEVVVAPRVGITKNAEALLRFYIKGSPFISRK